MTSPGHLTEEQCARYGQRTLNPEELLAIDEHIAICIDCRDRLYRQEHGDTQLQGLKAQLGAPGHRWRVPLAVAAALALAAGIAWLYRGTKPGERLTREQSEAIRTVLTTRRFDRPVILDRLVSKPGVQLGVPSRTTRFDLLRPVGTAVIDDRPQFRWGAVPEATAYQVAIFDEDFRKVAESPWIAAPAWQPEQPLLRGRIYNWQVTARLATSTIVAPAPPDAEARFQVVDREMATLVETARREHPSNHLLLAILCARAAALDDVGAELDAFAAGDPATTSELRASLEAMRSR